MNPLALGMFGLSSAIGGIYEIGRIRENQKYWEEYRKNTGVSPRYPYRAGFSNLGYLRNAVGYTGYGFSLYDRW